MRPDLSRLMSKLHDAGLAADAWPEALQSLSDAVGVVGAAYITFNKITGQVDWACFSGLSEGAKPEYVRHYAALDPYSPLPDASWMKLSDCLPDGCCGEASGTPTSCWPPAFAILSERGCSRRHRTG